MRQILQDLKSGETLLADVPASSPRAGYLTIRTASSLVSAGTERMVTDFAKASLLQKARQQPDKVRAVIDKARTDGVLATYDAVTSKLGQPIPLGYCNAGRVLAVGAGVEGFSVGDRVVSNGHHAEVVQVPKNLCAKIPHGVSDDQAAFTVIASIGLQGIRLIQPTLGEVVVVSGLGLIGLIAVQLLAANGCRVLGFDPNAERVAQARAFGAEAHALEDGVDPVEIAAAATSGRGVDAVLITAATSSNALIKQAANMCRVRGRVVLTGVIGLELDRADFYAKEISFQVSCSYGPGRYDPAYEDQGQDYPLGFVRWTEQRNFEAILDLMARGRLETAPLITHRAPFSEAPQAYDKLSDPTQIGILLDYASDQTDDVLLAPAVTVVPEAPTPGARTVGLIGAGGFTQGVMLPAIKSAGGTIAAVATRQGQSGSIAARRANIARSVTDHKLLLEDPAIPAVMITTPHNSHASLVTESLRAGKAVFVEKPLCLSEAELEEIVALRREIAASGAPVPMVMVGFNRRFAPLAVKMKSGIGTRKGPGFGHFLVNAGAIPADHWTQDADVGGGRIIGEACHFIDFLVFLTGSLVTTVTAFKQTPDGEDLEDNVAISLGFADGSIGQVSYIANGHKGFPKERCTWMAGGRVLELDNFRRLTGHGAPSGRGMRQNKGHTEEVGAFLDALEQGAPAPIPWEQVENVTRATFAAVRSMRADGERIVL